ncbi:hypothetical protein ACFYM7_35590 [Streptomyces cyaneofuscatus]|uniref:hypothetical protein n=1 Tax=Streptomyces cyaneofuscatus TaxID=66883 RepID=UPI00367EA8AA
MLQRSFRERRQPFSTALGPLERRAEPERADRHRSEEKETARIRAVLAEQYPELAAVSGSASETQKNQERTPASF